MREMGFSHSAKSGAVTVTHAKLSDPYPEVIGHLPVAGYPSNRKSSCLFLHATGRTLGRVFRLPVGANLREQTRGKDQ